MDPKKKKHSLYNANTDLASSLQTKWKVDNESISSLVKRSQRWNNEQTYLINSDATVWQPYSEHKRKKNQSITSSFDDTC
jgi:hypothetical protein